jgi:hypothetical protein
MMSRCLCGSVTSVRLSQSITQCCHINPLDSERCLLRTTTMASPFVRSLARSSRASLSSRLLQRGFATSRAQRLEQRTQDTKTSFDYHVVEDLQGMSAQEILAEPGTREDAKMRHFTGMYILTFL